MSLPYNNHIFATCLEPHFIPHNQTKVIVAYDLEEKKISEVHNVSVPLDFDNMVLLNLSRKGFLEI